MKDLVARISNVYLNYKLPKKKAARLLLDAYEELGDDIWSEGCNGAISVFSKQLRFPILDISDKVVISQEQIKRYKEKGSGASCQNGQLHFAPFKDWYLFTHNDQFPAESFLNATSHEVAHLYYHQNHTTPEDIELKAEDHLRSEIFAYACSFWYMGHCINKTISREDYVNLSKEFLLGLSENKTNNAKEMINSVGEGASAFATMYLAKYGKKILQAIYQSPNIDLSDFESQKLKSVISDIA